VNAFPLRPLRLQPRREWHSIIVQRATGNRQKVGKTSRAAATATAAKDEWVQWVPKEEGQCSQQPTAATTASFFKWNTQRHS